MQTHGFLVGFLLTFDHVDQHVATKAGFKALPQKAPPSGLLLCI